MAFREWHSIFGTHSISSLRMCVCACLFTYVYYIWVDYGYNIEMVYSQRANVQYMFR